MCPSVSEAGLQGSVPAPSVWVRGQRPDGHLGAEAHQSAQANYETKGITPKTS